VHFLGLFLARVSCKTSFDLKTTKTGTGTSFGIKRPTETNQNNICSDLNSIAIDPIFLHGVDTYKVYNLRK